MCSRCMWSLGLGLDPEGLRDGEKASGARRMWGYPKFCLEGENRPAYCGWCVCVCWGAGDGGDKVVIVSEEPVCFGVPGNSQTPKGTEEPVEWCSHQVPSKGSSWSLHVCALLAFVVGHSHHETPESGIPHCWVFQRQDKEARASHFPACSSKRYTQVAPSPGWELGAY